MRANSDSEKRFEAEDSSAESRMEEVNGMWQIAPRHYYCTHTEDKTECRRPHAEHTAAYYDETDTGVPNRCPECFCRGSLVEA